MKYYVYFKNAHDVRVCHCFEQDEQQAEHFAKLVGGAVVRDF